MLKVGGRICKEIIQKSNKFGFIYNSCENLRIWKFEDLSTKLGEKRQEVKIQRVKLLRLLKRTDLGTHGVGWKKRSIISILKPKTRPWNLWGWMGVNKFMKISLKPIMRF